jgi:hypothetical protein
MRVGLEHLGQSVLLVVSIIFLRSAVLAILAMVVLLISFWRAVGARRPGLRGDSPDLCREIHHTGEQSRGNGGTLFW